MTDFPAVPQKTNGALHLQKSRSGHAQSSDQLSEESFTYIVRISNPALQEIVLFPVRLCVRLQQCWFAEKLKEADEC